MLLERQNMKQPTYVPLVSSGVAGPLGILHLPRLWQKVSLELRGLLALGYPGIGPGFDKMVIDRLRLDQNKLVDFIRQSNPTYPEFEAWIKSQPGVQLHPNTVRSLNAAIRGYIHSPATRASILAAAGIDNDNKAPNDAVNLNNLDDWQEFHETVLKNTPVLQHATVDGAAPAEEVPKPRAHLDEPSAAESALPYADEDRAQRAEEAAQASAPAPSAENPTNAERSSQPELLPATAA
jgi:hypothetical protein